MIPIEIKISISLDVVSDARGLLIRKRIYDDWGELTAAAFPAWFGRSFGILFEWVEVPTGIVAQLMGHKPSVIAEKHYIQRELDLLIYRTSK